MQSFIKTTELRAKWSRSGSSPESRTEMSLPTTEAFLIIFLSPSAQENLFSTKRVRTPEIMQTQHTEPWRAIFVSK